MKKTVALLLTALLSALAVAAQGDSAEEDRPLVLRRVTVIDVRRGRARREMTLIMRDGRISRVGKNIQIPPNARVVNAEGKFLIPGLWDMHVHVDDAGGWMFPLFVANGVVGVRDMGSEVGRVRAWREARAKGASPMPQVVASGPIVSGKIGDADPRMLLVGDRQEAARAVDRLARQGVDFVKVHDWVSREAYLGLVAEARKKGLPLAGHQPVAMTAAEISGLGQKSVEHFGNAWGGLMIDCSTREAALRREAQSLIPLTAPEFSPPKLLARLGGDWNRRLADSYSPAKAAHLARVFRRNKTWFTPTIYGAAYVWTFVSEAQVANDPRLKYMPPETQKMAREAAAQNADRAQGAEDAAKRETERRFYRNQLHLVRTMRRAGVRLLAGTDALPFPPLFPGFSLHDELEKLVEAGLSPAEALEAATLSPARFFGREDEFGTVERGKLADLVLLDSDPLGDIGNVRKINAVVLNGRFFDRDALDRMLAEVEKTSAGKGTP